MAAVAEAAKCGTRKLSLLLIYRDQFDTGSGDELVEMMDAFGAVS